MSMEEKDPKIVRFLNQLSKAQGGPGITPNKCALCGHKVSMDEFRDSLSLREWNLSRMCMECQDKFFKG